MLFSTTDSYFLSMIRLRVALWDNPVLSPPHLPLFIVSIQGAGGSLQWINNRINLIPWDVWQMLISGYITQISYCVALIVFGFFNVLDGRIVSSQSHQKWSRDSSPRIVSFLFSWDQRNYFKARATSWLTSSAEVWQESTMVMGKGKLWGLSTSLHTNPRAAQQRGTLWCFLGPSSLQDHAAIAFCTTVALQLLVH